MTPSGRVFITGMGAVTPYGQSVARLWQALLKGKSAIGALDRFDLGGMACDRAGLVGSETLTALEGLDGDGVAMPWPNGLDPATALAFAAAREAVAQADGGTDLGIVAASNFGALDLGERALAGEAPPTALAGCAPDFTTNELTRRLALEGPSVSLSLSCAAIAAAIAYAAGLLRAQRAQRVLVVGYDFISRAAWSGLCSLRTMTRDAVRPFDLNRSGTIFSEGAAALVLESEETCHQRGGTPLAELAGWATGNNGHHMTAPAPRGAGSADVMRRALTIAGLAPEQIDHINAHGTATKPNDLTEAQALADVFGSHLPTIPVTSNKGAAGHLLGAAGGIEAISAILTLRTGLIPPTANFETPDPQAAVNLVTGEPLAGDFSHAISNSAGFGGCNAALVLSAV